MVYKEFKVDSQLKDEISEGLVVVYFYTPTCGRCKMPKTIFNKLQDIFFDNNFQFKYKDFNYTNPMIDVWCFDNIVKINICNIELNIIRIEKRILLDTLCYGDGTDQK